MTSGKNTPDLLIIGGGTAGLVASLFARRLGAEVVLAEKERIGGDCTWTGCVPSKALLHVAEVMRNARAASDFVVDDAPAVGEVDFKKVRRYLDDRQARIAVKETPEVLQAHGVDVRIESVHFVSSTAVQVGEEVLQPRRTLICTGAHPRLPAIEGLVDVDPLTSSSVFSIDELPPRLAVLGAGPMGCEMAQAFARLGSDIVLIGPQLLPHDEPEVRGPVSRSLKRDGVNIVPGLVASTEPAADGIRVSATVDGELRTFVVDRVLIATGRVPSSRGLGLDAAGIKTDREAVVVDDSLETTAAGVFAAGDIIGRGQFTHLAGWQAVQAVRNALIPGRSSGTPTVLPWVTFTSPEVAHVGLTEMQARESGGEIDVRLKENADIDRAVCEDDEDGFTKLILKNGRLVGATVVSARAGEVLSELCDAIARKAKLKDLALAVHPYPTWSFGAFDLAATAAMEDATNGGFGSALRAVLRATGAVHGEPETGPKDRDEPATED